MSFWIDFEYLLLIFSPEPTPTWYKDGLEISQDNTDGFFFEVNFKPSLPTWPIHFRHTAKLYHSMWLWRRPANMTANFLHTMILTEASKLWLTVNLCWGIGNTYTILAAPYWPDGPPANVNTSEGESVTYDCQTNGKPLPVVTFYKNGVGKLFDRNASYNPVIF